MAYRLIVVEFREKDRCPYPLSGKGDEISIEEASAYYEEWLVGENYICVGQDGKFYRMRWSPEERKMQFIWQQEVTPKRELFEFLSPE